MQTIPLKNRTLLVTGASRPEGLGAAIAAQAAREGATVLLTARDADTARDMAERIAQATKGHNTQGHDSGGRVSGYALDLTDRNSIDALVRDIARDHDRLDVLINNAAGMNAFGEMADRADLDAARAVMDVTLFGSWALIQALLPRLRESDHGRIVNVTSGAGSHGDPQFGLGTDNAMGAGYGAAKAALNALTHRLAHEDAKDAASRLRINAVCPGFTATFEGGAEMGARPAAESAKGVLWAATLPDDGPTGGFFRDGEPLPW